MRVISAECPCQLNLSLFVELVINYNLFLEVLNKSMIFIELFLNFWVEYFITLEIIQIAIRTNNLLDKEFWIFFESPLSDIILQPKNIIEQSFWEVIDIVGAVHIGGSLLKTMHREVDSVSELIYCYLIQFTFQFIVRCGIFVEKAAFLFPLFEDVLKERLQNGDLIFEERFILRRIILFFNSVERL